MKVYVVTKGHYGDYHIMTATTDEKLANEIAKKFSDGWDKARVEEYEDAELYLKPIFFVRFDRQGKVIAIYNKSKESGYYDLINECDFDVYRNIYVTVQADNEEHAIKIASEKRTAFLERESKEKDNDN